MAQHSLFSTKNSFFGFYDKVPFRRQQTSFCRNHPYNSGVYEFFLGTISKFSAFCDMDTDQGGWLVFQRRQDGSVDFYRNYSQYVNGFGDVGKEHWLGLELLHQLTTRFKVKLRVDLEDWEGNTAYATYSEFSVGNASSGYRLSVSGYNGTAGDALMIRQNGMKFTTYDRDQDIDGRVNCAVFYSGAWWYGACHYSNLNGLYRHGRVSSFANTVVWYQWKGFHYSLKRTEMKIKLVN